MNQKLKAKYYQAALDAVTQALPQQLLQRWKHEPATEDEHPDQSLHRLSTSIQSLREAIYRHYEITSPEVHIRTHLNMIRMLTHSLADSTETAPDTEPLAESLRELAAVCHYHFTRNRRGRPAVWAKDAVRIDVRIPVQSLSTWKKLKPAARQRVVAAMVSNMVTELGNQERLAKPFYKK